MDKELCMKGNLCEACLILPRNSNYVGKNKFAIFINSSKNMFNEILFLNKLTGNGTSELNMPNSIIFWIKIHFLCDSCRKSILRKNKWFKIEFWIQLSTFSTNLSTNFKLYLTRMTTHRHYVNTEIFKTNFAQFVWMHYFFLFIGWSLSNEIKFEMHIAKCMCVGWLWNKFNLHFTTTKGRRAKRKLWRN